MKNQEKEIKLDNNVTVIFTGNENKKKLDEILWHLIRHFEERIGLSKQ